MKPHDLYPHHKFPTWIWSKIPCSIRPWQILRTPPWAQPSSDGPLWSGLINHWFRLIRPTIKLHYFWGGCTLWGGWLASHDIMAVLVGCFYHVALVKRKTSIEWNQLPLEKKKTFKKKTTTEKQIWSDSDHQHLHQHELCGNWEMTSPSRFPRWTHGSPIGNSIVSINRVNQGALV